MPRALSDAGPSNGGRGGRCGLWDSIRNRCRRVRRFWIAAVSLVSRQLGGVAPSSSFGYGVTYAWNPRGLRGSLRTGHGIRPQEMLSAVPAKKRRWEAPKRVQTRVPWLLVSKECVPSLTLGTFVLSVKLDSNGAAHALERKRGPEDDTPKLICARSAGGQPTTSALACERCSGSWCNRNSTAP